MTVSVYLPVLLSLLFAAASRVVAMRTAPTRTAVVVVTVLLCAIAETWGLILLAGTLLSETSVVIREADERGVQLYDPVPHLIGVIAAVTLVLGVIRLIRAVRVRRATGRELQAVCHSCGDAELAVVELDAPHAFAVPGRPGRILVTRGLLSVLDDAERRAVLAHERAHLLRRHDRLRATTDFCAAVNPMLIPLREAVAFLVERNADECAAAVTGSRELVARALVKVALAQTRFSPGALAFLGGGVPARVAALHRDPPRNGPLVPGGLLALGVATTVAAAQATLAFFRLIYWLWPT